MNLFVWNTLDNRESLSFALRRRYMEPFEPAILDDYMKGNNYPDILFRLPDVGYSIDGNVAFALSVSDLYKLDSWHAIDIGVHKRIVEPVKVMRGGGIVKIMAVLYVAGPAFSKLKTGVRLK